jgi:hypothetical protein
VLVSEVLVSGGLVSGGLVSEVLRPQTWVQLLLHGKGVVVRQLN